MCLKVNKLVIISDRNRLTDKKVFDRLMEKWSISDHLLRHKLERQINWSLT